MIVNRIRQLRLARSLTLQQLADAVGTTTTTISRMEKGEVELVHAKLEAVARQLGCDWLDLVREPESPTGFADSAAPFVAPRGHPLAGFAGNSHDAMFQAKDDMLDAIGIRAGDIVIFDVSAAAVRGVQTGDVVVAQVYGEALTAARTVMRQYVAPDLLVANMRHGTAPPINMADVDAAIKGVERSRWVAGKPRR